MKFEQDCTCRTVREHEDESRLMGNARMTTKEKVKKLKADLERKMRVMRGEEVDETQDEKAEVKVADPDDSVI